MVGFRVYGVLRFGGIKIREKVHQVTKVRRFCLLKESKIDQKSFKYGDCVASKFSPRDDTCTLMSVGGSILKYSHF